MMSFEWCEILYFASKSVANEHHMREISDVFLLRKTLQ